ncbi:PREDICTED: uncharacterized protein LOC109341290 isoform X2 [Lupinus angustifolius]|uniref:uncharacterized protein LOC109341290 isoform X2 n=1 Tax=Lupinus angustifolius TaxID=3871 RepID=UPI00092E9829|nr:PREDICTED: uncharacterized protein LOC109341290 isoform X2 [Lupinus angustifolius]
MERKEKKRITSVPQFGGWDQNAPGATNYSMVFTQARANKKHMKTDLTEIKRNSLGKEHDFVNTKRGHSHHAHHHDPIVKARKKRIVTYINCCIRP